MNNLGFWKVTALAALVLLVETVLFHVVSFLFDYFFATGVISWAVLGIGIGAFLASRLDPDEDVLFLACAIGATASVYATSLILIWYPVQWCIAAGIAMVFVFPVLYISMIFRRHAADRVYLYDMAGAGLGVILTVGLYELLRSEGILLLIVTVIPLLALLGVTRSATATKKTKVLGTVLTAPLIVLGVVLFGLQVGQDTFNVIKIMSREAPYDEGKIFNTKRPERLVKSYDSLVGRIDVLKAKGKHHVCYNGYGNDHFRPQIQKTYKDYKAQGVKWPTGDSRVLYGLTEEPQIFIIGSAARGITPTAKKITPVENIYPVEIDPAILEIMQKDFFKRSGKAYEGLEPKLGNALSRLKALDREFDIITLINTHSGRTIGYRSGPDYLQTRESYNLYLDHLSEDGFVLFEERPFTRGGMMGVYRMINTAWQTLKERGAEDPSQHFFIWEWMVRRTVKYPKIDLRYDTEKDRYRQREGYYMGMIMTREPIVGERREKLLDWYHDAAHLVRMVYLKDHAEYGEMGEVFTMAETGDFSPLAADDFDPRILTNDRPFASLSRNSVPEVSVLLKTSGAICLVLGIIFLIGTAYGAPKRRTLTLGVFNILIGFGYFLIEILQLQVYQNVFVSPSSTLILVLGLLLISSGVGGVFAGRLQPWVAAAALMPIALLSVYMPGVLLDLGLPPVLTKIFSVGLICASGFLMGVFFPRGLQLAGLWNLRHKIPYLFAVNSVAGSFAVILALYSGIRFGYSATIVVALGFYAVAALILRETADGTSE